MTCIATAGGVQRHRQSEYEHGMAGDRHAIFNNAEFTITLHEGYITLETHCTQYSVCRLCKPSPLIYVLQTMHVNSSIRALVVHKLNSAGIWRPMQLSGSLFAEERLLQNKTDCSSCNKNAG